MPTEAFRIVYSSALGSYQNFSSRTDGLFVSGNTAPNVADSTLFYSIPTSPTSIASFRGYNNDLEEGQKIIVFCNDTRSTFVNSPGLRLLNGQNITCPAGTYLGFVYHNSVWYENFRSMDTANTRSYSAGTFGNGTAAMIESNEVIFTTSSVGNGIIVRRLFGAYIGQPLNILNINSSMTMFTNSAGATDSFIVRSVDGSSAIVTGTTNVLFYKMVQETTNKWFEITPISYGSA